MIQLKKIKTPPHVEEAKIVSPAGSVSMFAPRIVQGGGWHHVMRQEIGETKPRPRPTVYCPKCGREGSLDHEIDAEGRVTPSVVCPHEGCDFHDNVQLLGWEP